MRTETQHVLKMPVRFSGQTDTLELTRECATRVILTPIQNIVKVMGVAMTFIDVRLMQACQTH